MKQNSTDLTQGSIAPQLIAFSMPYFAGQLFQVLYNSVDSMIVGRLVGTTALAAVSSSADIAMLLVGFFTGLSAGAGVLFSRFFGARDYQNLRLSIHTALSFSILLGIIMAAVGAIFTVPLLRLVACPDDVMPEASAYLRIYFAGILFTSIYNVGSGVLRAVGDSRDPFLYLVIASITNVALDLVFVAVFKMGVTGVALATIISQLLSVILVFRNMLKTEDVYKIRLREIKMHKALFLQILNLGIPAAIQTSLTAVSNLFILRYVNMLGSVAIAGFGCGRKVERFLNIIASSFGMSLTTYVSQNIGAQRYDRAFRSIRVCLLMCTAIVTAVAVPLYLFCDKVLLVFTDDQAAIAYGVTMLHLIIPLYILQVVLQVFSNATRGFGKSTAVMVLSLVGMVGLRQVFLHVAISIVSSVKIVFLSFPVGWFFADIMVCIYYYIQIHRRFSKVSVQT